MSKYFIVATSYYAHTVLYASNYVFADNESEFLLLKENHSHFDFQNRNVKLYDSMESAVAECDYVWVVDSNLRPGAYGKVCVLAYKYNKKFIVSALNFDTKYNIDSAQEKLFQNKPTILSIGIGESSQQYCTEIFLNEMLRTRGIVFDQFFSPTTQMILENIAKNKLVKKDIIKQIFNPQYSGNICVKGITFRTYSDFKRNVDEIKKWNIDVIIFNLNQNMVSNKEIIASLNNCFRRPVFFFCSQYIEVENNIPTTLFIRTKQQDDIPMISDEYARGETANRIISELSFPRHAYKII